MIRLRILSTLALASTIDAVRAPFEAEHGVVMETTLLPTALLVPRIVAGERGDVVILTAEGIAGLIEAGIVQPGSARDLVRSSIGIAVAAGAPRPDIGSEAALAATLLNARAVGLSRAGASGLFFAGLLERMGIAGAVGAKSVVIASGYTGELLLDGRADLAVQQVSELLMIDGIDVIGTLPMGLGGQTVFTGALFMDGAHAAAGAALLAMIATSEALLRARGLAPV